MSEFTPINTQDEFDAAIKDRLARQEAKIRGEYSDLEKQSQSWQAEKESYEKTIADNKTAFEDLNQKYTEASGKIAVYETDALKTKIAVETGLPMELRSYLSGSDENEIRKSAEGLSKFTKQASVPPLANAEPGLSGQTDPGKVAQRKFEEWFKNYNE